MNALEKLRNATQMLAEIRTAVDAKKLMDMAAAAEYYARKAKLGHEAQGYAHAIRIDAMSLLGGFLKTAEKHPPGPDKRIGAIPAPILPPARADLFPELSPDERKKLAAVSQALATIAVESPEEFGLIRDGVKTVTAVMREMKRAEVKETAKLPASKYRVLYADPPWKYGDGLTESYGPAKFHYPSMSIRELCDLPVADLCEENAVLFLWVTSPLLFECVPLVQAWGFNYKTSFVWDKIKHNMGHYNSVRHEFLLVCTRGSCLPDIKELIDSVQSIERTAHSAKPEEFRAIIDRLYPHGRRLELFARGEAFGWERWGNQAA